MPLVKVGPKRKERKKKKGEKKEKKKMKGPETLETGFQGA